MELGVIMEIRTLITFLQMTESRNFSKAAEILGYSQSAVTLQIQQLERELDKKLFDRIGRSVTITQYGQEFIPYAQEVVSAAGKAWNFAKEDSEIEGEIRVGSMESIMRAVFPEVLRIYHKRFPKVRVVVEIGSEGLLTEMIHRNELDVAYLVGRKKNEPDFKNIKETEEKIAVISNPSHPLAKRKNIPLGELITNDMIMMRRDNNYRIQFDDKLSQQNLSLRPFLELQSTALTILMVKQNPYITVLPEFAVWEEVKNGELVFLDIKDCVLNQWSQVIYHKNKVITPQIKGMLEELEAFRYQG